MRCCEPVPATRMVTPVECELADLPPPVPHAAPGFRYRQVHRGMIGVEHHHPRGQVGFRAAGFRFENPGIMDLQIEPEPALAGLKAGAHLRRHICGCGECRLVPAAADGVQHQVLAGLGPDTGHQFPSALQSVEILLQLQTICVAAAGPVRVSGRGRSRARIQR